IAAHLLAGGSLAQVAITSALTGAWSGFASFIILAAGVAAAGLLPDHPQERSDRPPIDLFPLLMALSTLLSGLILLAPLPQFDASLYDGVRSSLPIYGAAFIVSGLLLLAALLHPRAPRKAFVA